MPSQSIPNIQYIFATDVATGQTVLHSYNYTPIPNRPQFDNFVVNDLVGAGADGWAVFNQKILISGVPETIKFLSELKFTIMTIPLDYAENLYNDKLTTGTNNWKNQISAGVQTIGDNIVGDIGATAGLSVGGYAAAALGAGTIATGGLVLGGAIGGAYLTSKAFDAVGIKPEIGNLMQNILGLTSNDSASSIFTSGNYITYDAGNQTKFMSNSDIAKQIAIDGLLGNQTPDVNGVLKQNSSVKIKIKNQDTQNTYQVQNGDFADLIKKSNFTLDNVNLEDYIKTITGNNGNKFSMFEQGKVVPIKDGSSLTIDSIISTITSSTRSAIEFLGNQVQGLFDNIFKELFDDSTKDENGNTAAQRLSGKILADLLRGKDITDIAKDEMSSLLIQDMLKDVSVELAKLVPAGLFDNAKTAEFVQGTIAGAVINFAIAVAADHRMDSGEYGEAAAIALTSTALYNHFGGGAAGAGAVAAAISLYDSFKADHSMNSEQYEDTATSAAAAYASAYIGHMLGSYLAGVLGAASGPFAPIGAVVGYAIGYLVGYLLYNPLKNNYSDKVDGIKEVYDALEDLILKGEIASGEGLEENFKQILRGVDDFIISSTGRFVRDFGIGAYNLFGGHYGKTFKAGEYPDPYSYIKIEPKADGTGNNIIGVEREGVVVIAREYFHDDIFGNSGSDNLIGKSGTNTILGYEGNDHLEGRGDVDLLIGGKGDDEIFGGNGDDQIFGSEGNDILFGGNGNDVILGDTGGEVLNPNDPNLYNDFIQGGNGDDQIMGEAGNDTIAGNDGNDIILGGAGDDRIEGGAGYDQILGEDGDDTILAGDGNDIIDGGAGVDVIYAGAGNDNIRGGDDNDEIYAGEGVDIIYGDSGNDLINSGADNDLVFGGISNDIIYGADGDDTIHGEIGNDYVIGAEGDDTIGGGAGDDVLMGGSGNDTISTGEGNDTIIFRIGDGDDTIIETDTTGNDTLKLSGINSKLSNNTTNKVVLTKSGNDLIIKFKDDLNSIITNNSITVKDQFAGSEILKKIELADQKSIDLTNITINGDNSISYTTSTYANIDTSIQEELALGYNDMMQIQDEQTNPGSTYNASNYNTSGEQEEIDSEKYNEMQWLSYKKKRSIFGGHYTVWYKYYEKNLSGTNGNDRIVGHWWSENVYGGEGDDQLHGGDGNDNLYGGDGADILHGGAGADNVYGQAGEDLIYGGSGNDNLDGGIDNDTIYGNGGSDTITGNAGDDNLEGNDGEDNITDNDGNNRIIAGAANDIINAGAGNDYIEGNDDADQINAGDGNNLVYGNGGNDTITAGGGNDSIYGQEGSDYVRSGAGDDMVSGGADNDVIFGQDGADALYGDTGIDIVSGGNGDDYIYGGSGADTLYGDDEVVNNIRTTGAGNDMIKGGDGDDWIEGNAENDKLYGDLGSDKIYGGEGNDEIFGGLNGDVLEGGNGDDLIEGGIGNDILVDGAGSDTLVAGSSGQETGDSDILILTKEKTASTSIDTIKNFNKTEDKIILKVDYQNPISFVDIQNAMIQNGLDAEISLNNGQKIIIKNTNISDITANNFQIGLSGGENNDILFGTNGEDIIFGEEGNDEIYGGEGNDELWGGKGADALYGEGGDDILRYEADGVYGQGITKENYINDTTYYWGSMYGVDHGKIWDLAPAIGSFKENQNIDSSDDVIISGNHFLSRVQTRQLYNISAESIAWHGNRTPISVKNNISYHPNYNTIKDYVLHYVIEEIWGMDGSGGDALFLISENEGFWVKNIVGTEYSYDITSHFSTKNFYNSSLTEINGYNRTFDKFIGGAGEDTILMTEGNDVLALDDQTSAGESNSPRIQSVSAIHAGAGDDVINLSTQKYSLDDIVVYGGVGNDKIWSSSGDDRLFGDAGNDEIYGGAGNDFIGGGDGSDVLVGGLGNDQIEGGVGNDNISGEAGDDILEGGAGADIINGGEGSETKGDTISYLNSSAGVVVNIAINTASGGDAQGDIISNFENITGSNFVDTLTGDAGNNIIEGGAGDDILIGGGGSDTYVYNLGDGNDTIIDGINNHGDFIAFETSVKKQNLIFSSGANGKDLIVKIKNNLNDSLAIQDQLISDRSGSRVEGISFKNGVDSAINLQNQSFIGTEDQALTISLDQIEGSRIASVVFDDAKASYDASTGLVTYNSEANFNGVRELTYHIKDASGNIIKTNTVNLLINFVNDLPVANLSNVTVNEDATILIDVLANASDVDGDELNIVSISQPTNGIADIIGGKIIYKPNNHHNGTDSLIYTIKDSNGGIITKELTINILAGDDAPIVQNVEDQIIKEDNILVIDVLENSYDIDDEDVLTITSVSGANNGQILIVDNKLTYIPNTNYHGSETIEYTISDGKTQIVKNFNITIESVNDLPIATLVSQSLDEDNIVIIDVLQFASDADGDTLIIAGVSSPTNGIAVIENGKITYTPYPNYFGLDSFNYVISDGKGGLISKKIDLQINNVDDVPQIIIEGIVNSYEDRSVVFDILSNITDLDGDNLSITSVIGAQNGSVVIDNGSIIYTPNANYYGTETIQYTVSDGTSEITKELVINIASVNDNPIAVDDQISVLEDSDNIINILGNDSDVEDGILKREDILLGSALYGTVFLNANNQIIYRSNKNYFGVDQFTYAVKDSNGSISNISTVNLSVDNVNDAPTIKNSLSDQMVRANKLEEIDISKIFADADGDNLEIKIKMADGSALPDWISNTKDVIRINANNDAVGAINLILVASDGEFEIETLFTLVIKESLEVRNDDRINIIESTSGNDTVFAIIGKTDLIFAGEGDDDIMYITDTVWGAGYVATNSYTGDSVNVAGKIRSYDAFDGGKGELDTLYLTEGDDSIFLDDLISDNPTISGSRLFGVEVINALGGNDIIDLSSNIFTYGSVVLNGSAGNDYLWSNDGNDTINGAGGNDNIVGGRGNDVMLGGDGDDIIKGYDGNDSLTGGAGVDVLFGGAGNDIFIFTNKTDSIQTISVDEMDLIMDFARGQDKIDLFNLDFDSIAFGAGSNTSAHGLEYHYENGNTIINDSHSNFAVKLAGEISLDHNDFNF